MVQGMSKERAMKVGKQAVFQTQAHQVLQQKFLQDQFQKILLNNFSQYVQQNKLQNLTLRDLEDCLKLAEIQRDNLQLAQQQVSKLRQQETNSASKEDRKLEEKELILKKQQSPTKPAALKQKQMPSQLIQKNMWNTPQDIPATKIKIHHQFDPTLHFHHKLNVTVRNINAVIRLIFKNTKDQSAITAVSPGTSIHQTQSFIDENRLREIQKIATTMKVNIPRRFDSKSAIREFIQSRGFISAIKQSMNMQLYTQLNSFNHILDLINTKQAKIAKFFDKKEKPTGISYRPGGKADLISPTKKKLTSSKKIDQKGSQVQTPKNKKKSFEMEMELPKFSKKKKEQKQKLAKMKEEEIQFERELEIEFEREIQRKEENDLDPVLTKDEKIKIEQLLIEKKEKIREKEKLLEYTKKYYVGPGNNCNVVKNALKQRYWWTPAHHEDFNDANFIWTSWKRDKHIDFLKEKGVNEIDQPLKLYARMDNNKQLTNKKGIFINMKEYYTAIGVDPFQILPLTFHVKSTSDQEYQKLEQMYQRLQVEIRDKSQQMNAEIQKYLSQKKGGKKAIKIHDSDYDDEYDGYSDCDDEEIAAIKKKWRVPMNSWIVKPGENSNRGVGINVAQSLGEIRSLIGSKRGGQENTYIIQKYIDYPLLIHRRKFDFRVFAMLTSVNKKLKGYFYEDGYIRTSSREFDLDNLNDKFIHLTNDAIQKQAEDFGKFENFNKLSYGDFQRYLNQYHADLEVDVLKHIVPQMKKLITDTFRAVCFKIDPKRLLNSFEVLGYDFMLEDNFKLSLIEVNTNPCLETESPLLARIIPELIDNTFKIALDPIFPPPDLTTHRKLAVNELPQEIKYSLIFDEKVDGPELKDIFTRYYEKLEKRSTLKSDGVKSPQQEEIQSDEEEDLDDEEY